MHSLTAISAIVLAFAVWSSASPHNYLPSLHPKSRWHGTSVVAPPSGITHPTGTHKSCATSTSTSSPYHPPPHPHPVRCNASDPLFNPGCPKDYACIPNPDIFCTLQFPNHCINGMCVPYIPGQRCGGYPGPGGRNECKDPGQVCVGEGEEACPGVPDCPGYCVWRDGRDALRKKQ